MTLRALFIGLTLFIVCFGAGRWLTPHVANAYYTAFPPAVFEVADNRAYFKDGAEPVLLFATSTCPYCAQARELFARLGVPYRELLIDQSEEARLLYAGLGADGVPLTLIGNLRIHGYHEDVLRESIALLPRKSG